MRKTLTYSLFVALGLGAFIAGGLVAEAQSEPDPRATERAERRARNRDPEARATRRSEVMERRAEMIANQPPAKVRVIESVPLAVRPGGKPLGGNCPSAKSCELSVVAQPGEDIVVTAVWSATRIECDGVTAAAPPNGQAVSPWWRCDHSLKVEGTGAGWMGFATPNN